MKPPFEWDSFSDQPAIIRDKAYKRRMRSRFALDVFKMLGTSALVLPVALVRMLSSPANPSQSRNANQPTPNTETSSLGTDPTIPSIDFFGMGVNRGKGEQLGLIHELGVRHVLMRLPLWDLNNLAHYQRFAEQFAGAGKTVMVNLLQDREHIENLALLKTDLGQVFGAFQGLASGFQVGNAINRAKWGFFAVEEYLRFFKVVQDLRDTHFPEFRLLGPSVIDFEYYYTVRALFNAHDIQFDQLSSLLYVDRKGAPEQKQLGLFDTRNKIRLLNAIGRLSPKVKSPGLVITEVNWPRKGTAPYAPTSETECVDPHDYVRYMLDYHRIANETGMVDRIYWHQLIAPGYGLVDNRNDKLVKTEAFYAYQGMVRAAHTRANEPR